ncbi:MAG: hypothetical protein H6741_10425 [Alphaproteobacteria bacterium]|nr:hypothetical protein [Alphaproteobacteria bacterium]
MGASSPPPLQRRPTWWVGWLSAGLGLALLNVLVTPSELLTTLALRGPSFVRSDAQLIGVTSTSMSWQGQPVLAIEAELPLSGGPLRFTSYGEARPPQAVLVAEHDLDGEAARLVDYRASVFPSHTWWLGLAPLLLGGVLLTRALLRPRFPDSTPGRVLLLIPPLCAGLAGAIAAALRAAS